MSTTSFWNATTNIAHYPSLDRDVTVDVAVIGGGHTGAMTAYLLKRAGLKVALLERDRCGQGDTGFTSAHLTHVTDIRVSDLVKSLGKEHAQAVWEAGDAAIQAIEESVEREKIACDFARVPGFLSSALQTDSDERKTLREEAELAKEMGFSATYLDSVPLSNRPGIRFPNQARFHPLRFLREILERIPGDGSFVFDESEVKEIQDAPLKVVANSRSVRANRVVIATDVPLQGLKNLFGAALFQTKIQPFTSYVVGASIPKGSIPDMLLWDTSDPYFYFRLVRDAANDFAIFGGRDHKTGQENDTERCFSQLESDLKQLIPNARVEHRWSGQVIEAIDGLPYIGENAPNQFIATGFSGNGLTFGMAAALMACDWATDRKNPWTDLFAPRRKKLTALWNYLRENIDYPYYMLKDRLKKAEGDTVSSVPRGEGRILKIEGQRLAVYRDDAGKVTTLNPTCPHMGCIVGWNAAESTWDCPCHGSRFRCTGEILAGPAEDNLAQESLAAK